MNHQNKLIDSNKSDRRGVRPAVWWGIAGIVFLFSTLMHYGYFVSDGELGGEPNATGKVISCSPQWIYLGLWDTCDVRTPGRNAPVVEADDRIEDNILTTTSLRLGGADVGDTVPLSYVEGTLAPIANDDPRDPSDDYRETVSHWNVARSGPAYAAEVPVQALLAGFGIFFCVRAVLAFRKRFDAPAPAPASIDGMDKFVIGVILSFAVFSFLGAYLVGDFLVPGLKSGSIGSVLSGILMFALGLVGVSSLLGAAVMWSSARDGDSSEAKQG